MKNKLYLLHKLRIFFCALLVSVLFSACAGGSALAASSEATIYEKALFNSLYKCYMDSGDMPSNIDISGKSQFAITDYVGKTAKYTLPTGIGNTLSGSNNVLSCQEILGGKKTTFDGEASGILAKYGSKINQGDPTEFGYTGSGGTSNTECIALTYRYTASPSDLETVRYDPVETNQICFPVKLDGDGDAVADINKADFGVTVTPSTAQKGQLSLYYNSSNNNVSVYTSGEYTGGSNFFDPKVCTYWISTPNLNGTTSSWEGCYESKYPIGTIKNGTKVKDIRAAIVKKASSIKVYGRTAASGSFVDMSSVGTEPSNASSSGTSGEVTREYKLGERNSSFNALSRKLVNKSLGDFNFNNDDYALMYLIYIKGAKLNVLGDQCSTDKGKYKYAYPEENGKKWCEIEADGVTKADKAGAIYAGKGNERELQNKKMSDILADLKTLDFSSTDTDLSNVPPSGETPGGGSTNGTEEGETTTIGEQGVCYSAAESLGWILCPVIKKAGDVVDGAYDYIETNFLVLRADAFNTSSGTYQGWTHFRNLANILFAIGFIIVILSQITGIGISNYGIKKMLPRLIVVVVLINLSYVICQLIVDVSNILGAGMKDLFDNLPQPDIPLLGTSGSFSVKGLVSTIITALFTAGGAVFVVHNVGTLLLPFALTLLSFVISILFFFIILGVRQAGVILLVVVSPIAIVCYALPNTKSIFDKWKKILVGLVLVYPICGLLIGGGQYASALLLSNATETDGFFYSLVAMLVAVVPFFFIPSILRSSMQAMGNIGAKIATAGSRVGRFADQNLRKTDGYRDAARALQSFDDVKNSGLYNLRRRASEGLRRHGNNLSSNTSGNGLVRGARRLRGGVARAGANLIQPRAGDERRQNARYARYRKARQEDLDAAQYAGRELPRPNTEEGRRLEATARRRAQEELVSSMEDLYTSGRLTEYGNTNQNAPTIDANDDSALAADHLRMLERLADDTISDQERSELETRIAAAQNLLGRSKGGRHRIANNYRQRLRTGTYTNDQGSELSVVARQLMDSGVAAKGKDTDRELFDLARDLSSQRYNGDQYRSNPNWSGSMSDGDFLRSYGLAGVDDDYSDENFVDMHENVADDMISAMEQGLARRDQVEKITDSAIRILSDPKLLSRTSGAMQERLRRMAQFRYSSGVFNASDPHYSNYSVPTSGSSALVRSGASALSSINSDLASSAQQHAVNGTLQAGTDTYNTIQSIAENARRALQSGEIIEEEAAAELQKVLNLANSYGVLDMSAGGGKAFGEVPLSAIRVKGTHQSQQTGDQVYQSAYQRQRASYAAGNASAFVAPGATTPAGGPRQIDMTDFRVNPPNAPATGPVGIGTDIYNMAAALSNATNINQAREIEARMNAALDELSRTQAGMQGAAQIISQVANDASINPANLQAVFERYASSPVIAAQVRSDPSFRAVVNGLSSGNYAVAQAIQNYAPNSNAVPVIDANGRPSASQTVQTTNYDPSAPTSMATQFNNLHEAASNKQNSLSDADRARLVSDMAAIITQSMRTPEGRDFVSHSIEHAQNTYNPANPQEADKLRVLSEAIRQANDLGARRNLARHDTTLNARMGAAEQDSFFNIRRGNNGPGNNGPSGPGGNPPKP